MYYLSSNPRRQRVPESASLTEKHPVETAHRMGTTPETVTTVFCGARAAFLRNPSGHKARHRQTRPFVEREAGRGGGGTAGPQPRARVTRHKGDSREAAAGADLHSPATRNCGYRPAVPLPLPTQARLPARRPFCLLSPSVLAGPGPFPGSGYLVSIWAGGAGAGGCGGAAGPPACCAGARLPPPLSPVFARRPALSSGHARAAGLTLRRVGRCCCYCCAPGRARCRRPPGSGRRRAARSPGQHG